MTPQNNLPDTPSPKKEENVEDMTFDLPQPEPIKGFPELRWTGKRPFTSTHYYPAQLKERYGDPVDGWMNRIYWGDNLQVMSHLLKEFRGKVDLVYIDPPFDSRADYKKTISLHGKNVISERTGFEEKQYTDIWSNDEYLQFMYERFIIIKELLSNRGSFYLHCDQERIHLLRCIIDEVFGKNNFLNEIIWCYSERGISKTYWNKKHDNILLYCKNKGNQIFNYDLVRDEYTDDYILKFKYEDENGKYQIRGKNISGSPVQRADGLTPEAEKKYPGLTYRQYLTTGMLPKDWWELPLLNKAAHERSGYPTQKPETLLERIILASSSPNSIVLDCFMGSGTTQAVAMKLGRRFIGADINLGAIQTTTKRLNGIIAEKKQESPSLLENGSKLYLNFEVYNVNNYDVFRNPVQARELLRQALEIEPLESTDVFDGMKDGYKVKIMPVNRIATRADLNPLLNGINYRELDRQMERSPGSPAERIMLVCMGHEPDLAASLKMDIGSQYRVDVKVVDILRDRKDLTFKYDSEADIAVENGELIIHQFYPRNLLQKLSILDENVEDWRQLVETIAIDWNYNGDVLQPAVYDNPGKNELVQGHYPVPQDYGIIRVKITDLLSESLEMTLEVE